ncbi:MAG TPA: SDR family oxidoreductase [Blastocatellia bacterium]
MNVRLRKLNEQIIVITGATSGIGLATARMAARRGARLMLAARGEDALRRLTKEIWDSGGEAAYVVADVGREEDVNKIADAAVERFGGFDTWVNNAGTGIYGEVLEVPNEDNRRLFDTNFWGVVYGSQAAARHLKRRGGSIINVGSVVSDYTTPLQGMYCATKHAVKSFTDALRMELEVEGAPVSVTLIKPSAIATPFAQHAGNYLDREPRLPPPRYSPDSVAEAILRCAERQARDLYVGGAGKIMAASRYYAPRLTDKFMERTMIRAQQTDRPATRREGGLYETSGDLNERSDYDRMTFKSSLYAKTMMRPFMTGALLAGAGVAVAALARRVLAGPPKRGLARLWR